MIGVRDDQKLPIKVIDSSTALLGAILRDSKPGD